jgi:Regulator of chromosome condensation (RCC1) repeat
VLGHEIQADEYTPREVASLGTTIWLPPGPLIAAAGASCSLLKTSNGHVYYWGKHRSVGEAVMRPQLVEALANNRHVATHCDAGAQTVVCSTDNAQTVVWGQGPHGELGLGTAKSTAKPQFVDSLTGCRIQDLACGYGSTIYVVKDDDAEDKKAIGKLPVLPATAKEDLEAVWASMPATGGDKKAGKKKKKET